MEIDRVWAMPNKHTFRIKPIADLLLECVGDGYGWLDPFAGFNSPAEYTNDLDPETNASFHLDALEFLISTETGTIGGVLFDPPYSPRQVAECYKSFGRTVNMNHTLSLLVQVPQEQPILLISTFPLIF